MAAILAADVVGFSRLMSVSEEETLADLKAARREVWDPMIDRYRGRVFKTLGDGLLVEFSSVVDALRCAIDLQEAMKAREPDMPDERRLRFRIGVNLGDVMIEGSDIYGTGVNVAVRLESIAEAEGICVSQAVYDQVRPHVEARFVDQGEVELKNLPAPLRVYRVERSSGGIERSGLPGPEPPAPSIAVLPFVNMSADPDNEFFSDGMTEELINLLSKIPQLRTAARTSSFAFKGSTANVAMIARELGVASIVEGSVRRAGKRIRITAQLIDAISGFHVWSETYDQNLEDVFAVQDEIAGAIAKALEITLSPGLERHMQNSRPSDVEAYELYLRGRRYFYEERGGGVDMAVAMFSRAIEVDPGYARAHAGIADALAWKYLWYEADRHHLDLAEEHIQRALELDPDLAEGYAARGHVLALKEHYREADEAFGAAIERDPQLYEGHYLWARSAVLRGDYEAAAARFERAHAVRPDEYQAISLSVGMYRRLGRSADEQEARDRALRLLERQVSLDPADQRALVFGAILHADIGDVTAAKTWADRASALGSKNPSFLYNIACVHALTNRVDEAVEALEASAVVGAVSRAWVEHDTDFDAVRDHPGFRAFLETLDAQQ